MSQTTFTIDIISQKTIEIIGEYPHAAVLLAEAANPGYTVDAMFWPDAKQTAVEHCLGCNAVILTDMEDYSFEEESADIYCGICSKDEEFQAALREGGGEDNEEEKV